jgi:hypothetical protein
MIFFLLSFQYLPFGIIDNSLLKDFETDTIVLNQSTYYIHFHKTKNPFFAQKAHNVITEYFPKINNYFNYEPKEVHFVIVPGIKVFNGFATPIPQNLVFLYSYPPNIGDLYMGGSKDWITQLIVHEYAHIMTLSGAKNIFNIFGTLSNTFNLLTPGWFIEGIATWAESYFFEEGRLNDPFVQKQFAEILSNVSYSDIHKVDFWNTYPYGNFKYLFGGFFLRFLENRYPGANSCLYKEFKKTIISKIDKSFQKCLQKDLSTELFYFVEGFPKKTEKSIYHTIDFSAGIVQVENKRYYAYNDEKSLYKKTTPTHKVREENLETQEITEYVFNYRVDGLQRYNNDIIVKLFKDPYSPFVFKNYSLKQKTFLDKESFINNEGFNYENERFQNENLFFLPLVKDEKAKALVDTELQGKKYKGFSHLRFNFWYVDFLLKEKYFSGIARTMLKDPLEKYNHSLALGPVFSRTDDGHGFYFESNNIIKTPYFNIMNTIDHKPVFNSSLIYDQHISLGLFRSNFKHTYGADFLLSFRAFHLEDKFFQLFYNYNFSSRKIYSFFDGFSLKANYYQSFDFASKAMSFSVKSVFSKGIFSFLLKNLSFYSFTKDEKNLVDTDSFYNINEFNTNFMENIQKASFFNQLSFQINVLLLEINTGTTYKGFFLKTLKFKQSFEHTYAYKSEKNSSFILGESGFIIDSELYGYNIGVEISCDYLLYPTVEKLTNPTIKLLLALSF